MKTWYRNLPKGVRFSIHYGLMPVWLPLFIVCGCILICIFAPIVGAKNLWDKFE